MYKFENLIYEISNYLKNKILEDNKNKRYHKHKVYQNERNKSDN